MQLGKPRWNNKDLPVCCEKNPDLIVKAIQSKNGMQEKHTDVVTFITQCIKVAPTSTKIAMMTPRSRKPIIFHFPTRYLESDL
ncbi:hypothetical protein ACJMK2_014942 [Sinanodonta woodiana]|uniref:Uncharacterized protein n=1 Tax=Sinanodonta woodiana TaxID=1069815 RepID=A0ABD3V252_SINWO